MAPGPRPKVRCPVCGTEYGDLVTACPKCGAMNPGQRGGPPTTVVHQGPAQYSSPPPPPGQPAYYGQSGYYNAPPPPPAQAPPPGYGQYPAYQGAPPGQYPPGYGAPPPQKASAAAMAGLFFGIASFTCILIGLNFLQPACGGFAFIFSIIGIILGISVIGKEPKAAKAVIGFSAAMLIMVIIIVIVLTNI